MQEQNDPRQRLQDCEERVKDLEEENEDLRESSHAFGRLAERLNTSLQQERRNADHVRRHPSHSDDNRQ